MFSWKKTYNKYIIALGIILLMEIFVCNYLYFRNIGNEPIQYHIREDAGPDVTLNDMSVTGDGMLFMYSAEDAYIQIDNLDMDGRSLYLDLKSVKWGAEDNDEQTMDFLIEIVDESHPEFYNRAGVTTVSANIEQTKYINLRPMGNLKSIRIRPLNASEYDIFSIDSVVVNCKRPLFFSPLRVLLFFGIFLMIYHLRKGSPIYDIPYDDNCRRQRLISYVTLVLILAVVVYKAGFLSQGSQLWYSNPYDLLAHSMANGRVDLDLDTPVDQSLLALEDPYVPGNRVGVDYSWDCCYYEGKYYVYYGVVPELIFYLPHYLLTGEDFGVTVVGQMELELFIFGIFLCFIELGRRFSKRIPYVTWLLLLLATVAGLQVMVLSKQMLFYHIPVIMGCALTVWGSYFWISAKKRGQIYSVPRIAIGSLCMALTAGCRPHLIFGSLLALPLFVGYFTETTKEERPIKRTVTYLAAGAVPFVIVLGLLFYYNAIRFGSPFEFGAKYNLTVIDVTRVEANVGKLIPGLFWYLFVPPAVTTVFPFIQNVAFTSSYPGDFFALFSNGGFMVCNPLTFFVFKGVKDRKLFENKYQRGFFYTCLIITVIIIGINIMMGGFMTRYFSDFSPFVHFACILVICLMIAKADDRERMNLLPVITIMCIVTVFYHYLTYYVGEEGAFFYKFDREVFLRASLLWQWWE